MLLNGNGSIALLSRKRGEYWLVQCLETVYLLKDVKNEWGKVRKYFRLVLGFRCYQTGSYLLVLFYLNIWRLANT